MELKSKINIDFPLNIEDSDTLDDCFDSAISESSDTVDENIDIDKEEDEILGENKEKPKTDFSDVPKCLMNLLEEIDTEYQKDTQITIANIKEKAFNEASIKGKWCSKLMFAKAKYRELQNTRDELIEELKKMMDEKKDIKSYLKSAMKDKIVYDNKDVKELTKKISESKIIIDYLTLAYQSIKEFGFSVKNSIEMLKLERGM